MKLPAELVQQIIGSSGLKCENVDRDKRDASRVPVARRAVVLRKSGQTTAVIREISVCGVGLLCAEAMKHGDEFVLCLPKQNGEVVPVKCKAIRCQGGGAGVFVIGAEFTELLRKSDSVQTDEPVKTERLRKGMGAGR